MQNCRDNPSDGDLVRSARGGDGQAFGRLVDRYLSLVYAVAVRIVCDSSDAEDLTQDTFMRALERLHLYNQKRCFRNWLLKIATNLSINHLRSRQRDQVLKLRMADIQAADSKQDNSKLEVPGPRQWQYWLDKIDESQRAAIVLFHFHQMPYDQIAEALDVPLNTVRTLLYRGRRKLRELLTRHTDQENGPWNVAIQNG
ncbi:MAG: RNA polymerase sigma factor [Planctomycetota bacterium]|jgi:RNA polymerase sigma-70 factor (ECF subfamily)